MPTQSKAAAPDLVSTAPACGRVGVCAHANVQASAHKENRARAAFGRPEEVTSSKSAPCAARAADCWPWPCACARPRSSA
eukprot:6198049-Pleurochrysis_carterae.AAC.5